MEDVLEVYQRPYAPLRPVVCIDETNKQLITETRIPCEPGQPEKVDSVYVRNGVADVFMISEPLADRRETVVTQTRTALDFAEILRLHYIRPSHRKKHAGLQNALNGITRQNTGAGWTWQKLKSAS